MANLGVVSLSISYVAMVMAEAIWPGQLRPNRWITHTFAGDLNGPYFHDTGVKSQTYLVPLTTVVSIMLLHFPFLLTGHLDTRAIQHMFQNTALATI
ncbi:hypothetical protein FUT69_05580 [Xylella taiwanensis]|uniref:Uncharacterized protein n=1 Tax=Xylella taiwanensis TaxID=1444770 RepID=Z9JJY9_9GAMM|nr:hypothetical protein [Xylella taiwanensis]AXI83805.1 hypothetical protein AB672_07615 [Xylella taiwanensis]EWS78146.1 hypothetical protein AF72_06490 [Xylella taiwanensis]MCD8456908.1 hypothetical protein [Xylella taiwanensis]MCD8459320.1 hypothetical protein [Xylella taiwanensis]MCD8461809.1 hypothetical protein [Xylella taiwanensis]